MNDILFGNSNRPVIKKLSNRYFKAGKSRNIIAIIAIALTTILFTTIFTLGSGLIDTVHDQNIRKQGGDGQAVLNYISDEVFDNIKGNEMIEQIAYTKAVSYHINNPGLEKWRADMWFMDDTALKFARYEPTTGHRPEAENEIMADTKTLDALGIPAEIGATVTLDYQIKGISYSKNFVLCGFWETDSLSNIGRLIVSKAFIDNNSELLTYTYPEDNDYSGVVAAYVMFHGNGAIESKLHQLLAETGYTCDTMGGSPSDDNYVIARVSPAYQGSNFLENPALLISGVVGILLIMVTGYLIIYNIFQISVIQDIQSYGQLKTLGTTKVYASDAGVKVTANPIIFIGAALFALVTVIISVNKPAKIAGSVSPIEAIRYTENDTAAFQGKKTADKKSIHGAKIHRMALSNLGRNKKRTILVIISMTLSLVLFNTVFTLASGFDVEKYVEKFVNKDFIISTADYFNFKFGNSDSKNDLSTSFIEAVKQNPAFDEGGELYTTKILEETFSVENGVTSNYNKDAEGNPLVQLYGADDFLLNSMDVIEGTIDWEALKSGNYVLYALTADDNGNIIDDPNIHVGDTLHFNHVQMDGLSSSIDNSFDCKVMAKVLINENTDTIRSTGFAKFYMPTEVFLPLCDQPHLVSFPFNAVDGMEADMEEFLSSYVEDIEPSMNYDSKQTYINSFNDLTSLIITIGGALSIIIGLIGVTNFVNSVLTSIITRRKELAMLQSIGMTGKQLKKMLSFEGLYYAAGTVVASIIFGSLVSVIIVRAISNSIWFFTYKFVIFPMFVIYPFLIALTVIIPAIIYRKIAKTSIIERLHQN